MPVLWSPRLVCIQRGGRSERCSHTSQIQFSWFIPSSASGFLALLSKYIFGRNPTRREDVWFVPCPHLGISSWLRFPQVSPSSAQPAPRAASDLASLTASLTPFSLFGLTGSAWFCGDLFRGVLKDNVIAASADSPRNL